MRRFLVGIQIDGFLIPFAGIRPVLHRKVAELSPMNSTAPYLLRIDLQDFGVVPDRFFKIAPRESRFSGAHGLIGGRFFVFHQAIFPEAAVEDISRSGEVLPSFLAFSSTCRARTRSFLGGVLVVQRCRFCCQGTHPVPPERRDHRDSSAPVLQTAARLPMCLSCLNSSKARCRVVVSPAVWADNLAELMVTPAMHNKRTDK